MTKYIVNLTDSITGATSPIDTITAADNYTVEQYIADCDDNADDEWSEMLHNNEVSLEEVED